MRSTRHDEVRDYTFADQALGLRKRAGITQRELADLLGVSKQTVHAWEAGLSYPDSEHLRGLLTVYLERGALPSGDEEEIAAEVWEAVRAKAPRRTEAFDPEWFAAIQGHGVAHETGTPGTNLRPARSTFIGRTEETAELVQALDLTTPGGTRLLTLIGVAGSGKTRLALAAAERLLPDYQDGVWCVELASLSARLDDDPTPVAAAVLTVLGFSERSGEDLVDVMIEQLRSRRMLLVLDNCEHVVAACASLLTRLLPWCPELQVITTSQYTMGIPDELVWRVSALSIPEPVTDPTPAAVQELKQSESVQLFVERAKAVLPAFELNIETARAVAAICRQVDGLPLAIELAAARLNVLPLQELLSRLDDRFVLLRRGGRIAVDRHQTLQATMDWSYQLLDDAEKAVLRRVAIFAGGWELGPAEAVCADGLVPVEEVLELLDSLILRSLVYTCLVDETPRYGILETVRQHGLQQLDIVEEGAAFRHRHLAWCGSLVDDVAPELVSGDQEAAFARLGRELDNLRAGMQWAIDRGLGIEGLRVANGLWKFWRNFGNQREGRAWFSSLLSLPEYEATTDGMAVKAEALRNAGFLAGDQHDFAQAAALHAASSQLLCKLGRDESGSGMLDTAAMEARASGDYRRATTLLEESVAVHRSTGNRKGIMDGGMGVSLFRLALVFAEQGEYARSLTLYEECLALHTELGDREGIGHSFLGLGDVARNQGDAEGVRFFCGQSLTISRDVGVKWGIGFSLNNLALAALCAHDLSEAQEYIEESTAIFQQLKARPSLAEVLITLGRVRGAQGNEEEARRRLIEALGLAWEEGPLIIVTTALEQIAIQAAGLNDPDLAARLLGATFNLRRSMGTPVRPADEADVEEAMARSRRALGESRFGNDWSDGETLSLERVVTDTLVVGQAKRVSIE